MCKLQTQKMLKSEEDNKINIYLHTYKHHRHFHLYAYKHHMHFLLYAPKNATFSPISCGRLSSRFSSKSKTLSFFSSPIVLGSFCCRIITDDSCYLWKILKEKWKVRVRIVKIVLNKLLEIIKLTFSSQ